MKKIEIRPNGTKRVYTVNDEPSKADQSFKDDCDVNIILQRFMKTGQITHINQRQATYSDVSEVPNLLEAHIQLREAEKAFAKLPADVRKKLQNNPLMLEEYLSDPENHEEAVEYGLLNPKKESKTKTKPEAETKTINENEKASVKTKSKDSKSERTDD